METPIFDNLDDLEQYLQATTLESLLDECRARGVTQKRLATMSSDNYWARDGQKYAAIRVSEAKVGEHKKRGVDSTEQVLQENGVTLDRLQQMERCALRLLRAYEEGRARLETTLEAVLDYDRLHGDDRDYEDAYRRTLADQPWKKCGCPIYKSIGIEVIILRGNNRNRRRGFHNVKVFYDQFRRTVRKHSK